MAMHTTRTEHTGAKNSNAKSGFWGKRAEAKQHSNKGRRRADRVAVKEQS
jgi:hypothetical protein